MTRRSLTISGVILGMAVAMALAWFITGDDRFVTVTFWIWATPLFLAVPVVAAVALASLAASRTRTAAEAARLETEETQRRAHRTFVSRLDHELKNPVTALRMGVTQVADPTLAASLAAQVERLSTLVGDLRKITEVEDLPDRRRRGGPPRDRGRGGGGGAEPRARDRRALPPRTAATAARPG
ncbi:MAG TPA: HAMP domain-containing histidine kinase [Actinomycetales bacterium]|nr:HAMP domain-containing histidine kinase [Actinomycetales bacterium]